MPPPSPCPPARIVRLSPDQFARIAEGAGLLADATPESFNSSQQQDAALAAISARWPELKDFADGIAAMLDEAPYFVVVSGMPTTAPEVFFVALTRSLGAIAEPYQKPWSNALYQIRPQTDRITASGVLNQYLHTDGTHWPRPNDLTCLLFLDVDQNGGGRTRLLDVVRLTDEFGKAHPAALDTLSRETVPWALDQDLGGGLADAPVFGKDRIRWLRYTVDQAIEGGAYLSASAREALELLESFVESCPGVYEFPVPAGSLLIVNNQWCLHARTPIEDPANSHRHLARIKVDR